MKLHKIYEDMYNRARMLEKHTSSVELKIRAMHLQIALLAKITGVKSSRYYNEEISHDI